MEQNQLQTFISSNTLEQAVALLEQERDAAEAAGNRQQVAQSDNDLGVVLTMLKRYDEARAALERAQQLFITLNDTAGQGRATGNLAQLEERVGNGDASGALFMQAADLLHEGNAFSDEYATRKRLSQFYLSKGATMQALGENAKRSRSNPTPTRGTNSCSGSMACRSNSWASADKGTQPVFGVL